jgi:hypothetical protein
MRVPLKKIRFPFLSSCSCCVLAENSLFAYMISFLFEDFESVLEKKGVLKMRKNNSTFG